MIDLQWLPCNLSCGNCCTKEPRCHLHPYRYRCQAQLECDSGGCRETARCATHRHCFGRRDSSLEKLPTLVFAQVLHRPSLSKSKLHSQPDNRTFHREECGPFY